MGKETSERIQTSVLNAAEKKVLVWLAQRQPAWVTSDFLTYTGVVGALVCLVVPLSPKLPLAMPNPCLPATDK